jgi:hypothetical protein
MKTAPVKVSWFWVLFAAAAFCCISCSSETAIQQILGSSASAPVFLECRPVSPTEVDFRFSTAVRVTALNFDPGIEVASITEGEEVRVSLSRPHKEGEKVTADI